MQVTDVECVYVSMEGVDICCEIERRVSEGYVYSEAVTRLVHCLFDRR